MPQAVEGLRTMGARGWNITMPGKNIMCKLADKVSPASEISGACNTIVNDNGVLTAYTTDGVGFMKAVAENGVDIIGKKMTLLGAGGAATAILVQAALDGVAEINVFNVRDAFFPRAEEIVAKLNERTGCKAVSYTHLDVYKRQYPHRSRSESMHRPAVHQWYAAAAGEQQRDEEKAVDAANGII